MDTTIVGIAGIAVFLLLLALGVHIAVAMFVTGFLGAVVILGFNGGLMLLGTSLHALGSEYGLACIPLFILMGSFAMNGGFGEKAYQALYNWVRKLPGGMAIATTLACGAFGAASGSSTATAAIFTRVSLPEMKKYKYDTRLAVGCIAAAGTFAVMMPPSILLIVYGVFTDTSIGKLFIGGILPCIFTVIVYSVSIVYRVRHNPTLAPITGEAATWKEKTSSLPGLWPIALLALLVMGGIYAGWFTPTEAGSAGAVGAMVIGFALVGLRNMKIPSALRDTAYITAMIMAISIGAIFLSRFLAITQIPTNLATFLQGLPVPRVVILIGFLIMYFFLGMVINALGMLAVTLPIVAPVVASLGYDLVWFGIISIKMCEIAVVTPPVGLNVYIVKGAAGEEATLEQIFAGIWPFVICDFVVLIFLVAFPQISLLLPNIIG